MESDSRCVFCSPQIEPWVLWEGAHYRIAADAFPRLPGHILLITRDHLLHHADAPENLWPELEAVMQTARAFLQSTGSGATFWENGYAAKEVPHAHLHGIPIQFPVVSAWVAGGQLLQVNDWSDVRNARTGEAGYTFVAGQDGRYVALDRDLLLAELRQATLARTGQSLDPATGGLRRGGVEEIAETRRLWTSWFDGRRR
jgi:diadenosine tetraphosphate (Ap4A) HIT family hydrolase